MELLISYIVFLDAWFVPFMGCMKTILMEFFFFTTKFHKNDFSFGFEKNQQLYSINSLSNAYGTSSQKNFARIF